MAAPTTCTRLALMVAVAAVLAGCGGDDEPSIACDVASQKATLRGYMADRYLWAGVSPDPDPAPYAGLPEYLDALRYAGAGAVPADRFSGITDRVSFARFYGEGRSLGYGLAVNALELALPLRIRHVEPLSPAGVAGLLRGDTVVSINGRSAAELVAANDFTALTAAAEGDALTIVVDRGAGPLTFALTAAVYTLTPVTGVRTIPLAGGGSAGYLALKDFIPRAGPDLVAAFAAIRAAGASELIVDLRYNGGGRLAVAEWLASLIAGSSPNKKVLATLRYNPNHAGLNRNVLYGFASGAPFTRVVILTGARSCSASELLVNGLSPHMTVVTVGDTTCGKPVGFNPVELCGSVISAVNFDIVNSLGVGEYYTGLAPTCPASEDFTGTPGDPAERLTGAAVGYLNTGACPAVPPAPPRPAAAALWRAAAAEPDAAPGMTP